MDWASNAVVPEPTSDERGRARDVHHRPPRGVWRGAPHECSTPDGLQHCASSTTFTVCSKAENGGEIQSVNTCPDQKTCDMASGQCIGSPQGASCSTDGNRADSLRCETNVCQPPNNTDVQRCLQAPTVQLPADGSAVALTVPFSTDADLADRIVRPCGTSDGGHPSYGSMAFVQLQMPPNVNGLITHTDGTLASANSSSPLRNVRTSMARPGFRGSAPEQRSR